MASNRKLVRPSSVVEVMDRMVKEAGAEYLGPTLEEERVKFTKYQLMVYDCIRKNPGIWRKELERRIGRGATDAVYKLHRFGIVYISHEDGRVRYYVVGDGVGEKGKDRGY
jgi:chromosome segregation and condensation protein ScpB